MSNPPQVGGTTDYTYNTQGQVTTVTDENGNLTGYGYDLIYGDRTVITDALDQVTTFEYDDLGRVITTTGPATTWNPQGKVTVNEYDAADNLIKVTENYLAGQPQNYQNTYNLITQYTYDEAGRRETTTDTLDRVSRNIYDSAGRLEKTIENEHPSVSTPYYLEQYNLITTYGYDDSGRQITVTDLLGHVTRTEYDTAGRVYRTIVNFEDGEYESEKPYEDIITEYVYNLDDTLQKTVQLPDSNERRVTFTKYDDLNRVEQTIENYDDGVSDPNEFDQDLITEYKYDAAGNQIQIIDPLLRTTDYDYDALGRVLTITNHLEGQTVYQYDLAGNRISSRDPEQRTTTYDYDALNRVITTTNALEGQDVVEYDAAGNRVKTANVNLQTTEYRYDSLYRLEETEDAEAQRTKHTYDALGNRLTVTDAELMVTRYEYDQFNRVITTTMNFDPTGPSDSDTNVPTVVTYDALSRRTSQRDGRQNLTEFGYDALGRTIAITDALGHATRTTYDGLGNRRTVTNAELETTTFDYDGVNRLVKTINDLGHKTDFVYNKAGERTAMVDAETITTTYGYDGLGRLTRVTENYVEGGPSNAETNVLTQYGYDRVGNRTVITNARTLTTTYVYDDLNRRTLTIDALGHRTAYGYDAIGNRTVITDANQVVTHFDYDDVNRLIGIDYSDSTPDVTLITYDQVGNRETMNDGTGQTSYGYDDLYRLTSVNDGAGLTVGYAYDEVGNRTRLLYPLEQGGVVTYTYDAANRLETVMDWNNGQFEYNYDDANRLTGLTLPNSLTSTYTYDDAGRLTDLSHSTAAEMLASYDYALDNVGNRRILTETIAAISNLPHGTFIEENGQIVMEGEHGERSSGTTHQWNLITTQPGYTGTSYLQALPDSDELYQPSEITASPRVDYPIYVTMPETYTLWLRGYPTNAAGDSVYVGLNGTVQAVSGFAPTGWDWANEGPTNGEAVTFPITNTGLYTISLWMHEDGLRLDRLLLTTDTTYIPTNSGPVETPRQLSNGIVDNLITRTIVYTYDGLHRLTEADYSTEVFVIAFCSAKM